MPTRFDTRGQQSRRRNTARLMFSRDDRKPMADRVLDRTMKVVPVDINIPWWENEMTEQRAWEQGLISLQGMSIFSDMPEHRWLRWRQAHSDFPTPKGRQITGKTSFRHLYDARELGEWYKDHLSDVGQIVRKTSRQNQGL